MTVRLPAGPLELGPPRRRAVFALLLVNAGKVVPISSIVRSIWETEPPDHAVATLQSYVSRLRKSMGGQPLHGGAELQLKYHSPGYVLTVTPDHVDVMTFEQTVNRGLVARRRGEPPEAFRLLSEALRLWTAPPFEDLVGYDFAAREAARLDHLRLTAVEVRAETAFALGRSEEVLPELEKEVALHPVRERLVYELMRAQYRNGQQADALYLFERTRQYLADELGADVSPELRRVHEEILRHDPSLTPAQNASTSPLTMVRSAERADPAAPPVTVAGQHGTPEQPVTGAPGALAGRRRELRRLMAAAEAAQHGDGRALLVVGEAGMGKTRLVQEFGRRCHEAGTDVLTVCCPQGDDMPPYWPWTQALRRAATRWPGAVSALPDSTRRALASLVPELDPDPDPAGGGPPQPPGEGGFEFHDAMSQALLGLARSPLVLVLEDFQRADAASLSLLRFFTSQLAESRFLLVVTSRTFRIADDPGLRATRAAMLQLVNAEEIQLGALAAEDAGQLVRAACGRAVDPELCSALHERSGGNPYFLLGLAESLRQGATASEVHDLVPAVVREVITERLSGLPADILTVLNACAVLGPDSVRGAVEDAVSGDWVSPEAVRRAVRGGLLAVDETAPERIDFVHPLIRDVVRQELTHAELHRRTVCSLAGKATDPDVISGAAPRQGHGVLRAVASTRVTGPQVAETEDGKHRRSHGRAPGRLR